MDEKQIIQKTEELSKYYTSQILIRLKDWDEYKDHVLKVRDYALDLAKIEEVDSFVIEIAALLHDIGKVEGSENHAQKSYEIAKKFLFEFNISQERKDLILECIKKHSSQYSSQENLTEVKVLQSADAMATLFDDKIQNYCIENYDKETYLKLLNKTFLKISLDSARELSKKRYQDLIKKIE